MERGLVVAPLRGRHRSYRPNLDPQRQPTSMPALDASISRPELVADEKGRSLPVHTDRYISGAVFDPVHSTIKTAAVWSYLLRLLALLKGTSNQSPFAGTKSSRFAICASKPELIG
jgi:hypothetical protein